MKKVIDAYINSKNSIMNQFGCTDDFPIKPVIKSRWAVSGEEGIFFFNCWDDKNQKTTFAIAKKDGDPMIYKSREYSLIVAIDCIKIAFVCKNTNMI